MFSIHNGWVFHLLMLLDLLIKLNLKPGGIIDTLGSRHQLESWDDLLLFFNKFIFSSKCCIVIPSHRSSSQASLLCSSLVITSLIIIIRSLGVVPSTIFWVSHSPACSGYEDLVPPREEEDLDRKAEALKGIPFSSSSS